MIFNRWQEAHIPPFDELMISWNASRPQAGKYSFYVSVKIGSDWSPWLLYAIWGSTGQASCSTTIACVNVHQDIVQIIAGKKATGFHIKVESEGDAALSKIHGIHIYTNSRGVQTSLSYTKKIYLLVSGLSQMTVDHVRHRDLCSPTSTTAIINYLSCNHQIDVAHFAQHVWDGAFDIFGNWVLNVAQASVELGPSWNVWVERLNGFDDIYQRLHQGFPVIVSVRGPLPGSAQPYAHGHLMAVIGYDPEDQKVHCMDPGFPSDEETHVSYAVADFTQAWNRRGKIAYLFSSRQN